MENIPAFIAGVKAKKEKLFGFGHRVYRNFDPRAKIIKEVCVYAYVLGGGDPCLPLSEMVLINRGHLRNFHTMHCVCSTLQCVCLLCALQCIVSVYFALCLLLAVLPVV